MKIRLPFVVIRAATQKRTQQENEAFKEEIVRLNKELSHQGNDVSAMRSSMRGSEQAHARELLTLNDKVLQLQVAQAMAAEKQREIAALRTQLATKEQELIEERKNARDERQKLVDWIAKGVSNGIPVFAEIPLPVVEPETAAAPPSRQVDRVPSELEDAIAHVGRRPRAIVKHITRKNDTDFISEMAGAGVRRRFEDDAVDAEVEAELIHEQSHSQSV